MVNKDLFLISLPIFILHGLEEYFTDFFVTDSSWLLVYRPFQGIFQSGAVFIGFQLIVWLLLFISYRLVRKGKLVSLLVIGWSIIFVLELQHLIMSVLNQSYYPGTITAVALVVIGGLFWKNLYQTRKLYGTN